MSPTPTTTPPNEHAKTIHGLSDPELRLLTTTTLEARNLAYCPYSHFRVGATLLTTTGALISGANVENAAYPVTTCAERVALCAAVTTPGFLAAAARGGGGNGKWGFRAVGVATDIERGGGRGPASPCGMCRQALREFCELSMPVFMYYSDGSYLVRTLGELLPLSFGPESLPPPEELPTFP